MGYARKILAACVCIFSGWVAGPAFAEPVIETVARSDTFPMNGVAVTRDGRIFVSMPQWVDTPSPSVAEVMADGTLAPYPGGAWNAFDTRFAADRFMNVNTVHYDGAGSLWAVDYAAPNFGPVIAGAQKLVQIDLTRDAVARVYRFDGSVLPDGAKLNDVRVDAARGVAYLSEFGLGAIIVLDLETGAAFRALDQHYSTRAHPDVTSSYLSVPFRPDHLMVNDIELSADGETLFYQPTGGPVMWRIPTTALSEPRSNDALETFVDVAGKSTTIGGMTRAPNGDLLLGSVSDNAVWALNPETGTRRMITHSPFFLWPDAMAVGPERDLYVPAPQLRGLPHFNDGVPKHSGIFSVYKFALPDSRR